MATFVHRKMTVFPSAFFDPLATLEAIENERCSVVMGTPTMFVDMVNHPVIDQTDLSSLKTAVTGGAPCPVELWRQIEEKMKITNIINGYGTTENSPATLATRSGERTDKKYHTVGTPFDHVEVKIIDKNGHIVPVNTKGELCTRGHVTFLGYWGDEQKTAEVMSPDRWYRTGDIATMDDDGYVSIVGRIKEMIIRGGENMYPREVEEFLHTHPFVAEVQVVGVPDPRLGEEVGAWVKLKTGKTLTEKELREYCNGKVGILL
ncbi:medium-chain acyl-CoA ligase ACSF2, mitochondrial-like [Tachypleus tridentatus]|uniref:medium-chain acyl-CoA ligase ACSF2, mitochondrial-like n=1 Tax=Tachypleus tridentatus TaxID=6853 RepID=UPI003FD67664